MSQPLTVILSNGGIRSLVAAASVLTASPRPVGVFLQVSDGRVMAKFRYNYVQKLAKHFGIDQVLEWHQPRVASGRVDRTKGQGSSQSKHERVRLLFAAVSQASDLGADRLVWPVQVDADVDAASRITEQAVLLSHMLELDHAPAADD